MKKSILKNSDELDYSRRNLFKFMGAGLLAGSLHGQKISGVATSHARRDFVAMWTHACNLQVEYPDRIEGIYRKAFHTRIQGKPNTSNWVHFAIPTPVVGTFTEKAGGMLSGKKLVYRRYRPSKVFINFRSASVDAKVISIHLHDGPERIAKFENLNLYGENPYKGFHISENPEIHQGICLSVAVDFGKNLRWIEFHSAGVDFFISV